MFMAINKTSFNIFYHIIILEDVQYKYMHLNLPN